MDDLPGVFDDLMAFVAVVDAGGYNAASLRFGIPASRLSRNVAALERKLGISLIVRTSRRFAVTELGRQTYSRGISIRAALQDTLAEASDSSGEPTGHLRVSCPMALATGMVGAVAVRFMQQHPRVCVTLESTDGRARPFNDPVDLMIQPTVDPLRDSGIVARKLVDARYVMVARPGLLHGIPQQPRPDEFPRVTGIGWSFFAQPGRWRLQHAEFGLHELEVDIRFTTDNLLLVREAARAGLGVAQLPTALCAADVTAGLLQVVAPDWHPPPVTIHALYPSRRALTLAGRLFLEQVRDALAPLEEAVA